MKLSDLPPFEVRIAYHRKSDDSISSSVWAPGELRNQFVEQVWESSDIDAAWFTYGMEVRYIKGSAPEVSTDPNARRLVDVAHLVPIRTR